MTCNCSQLSAFRWREWPKNDCFIRAEDLKRRLSVSISGKINEARERGVDMAHITGMDSTPAADARRFAVRMK